MSTGRLEFNIDDGLSEASLGQGCLICIGRVRVDITFALNTIKLEIE